MHEEENSHAPNAGPGSNPEPTAKKPVSPRKLQANRENAKKSPGPTREAGKARSSQNAYRHGFFAKRLFATAEQVAKDGAEYLAVAKGLCEHYQPVGYLENLLVERIAANYLRLARIVGHEQRVFGWVSPFEERSAGSLPRYQATIDRQLAKDIQELERLQTLRKTRSGADGAAQNPEPPEIELPALPAAGPKPSPVPQSSGAKIVETNPLDPEASRELPGAGQLVVPGIGQIAETKPRQSFADVLDKLIN
jgi:hypothetical protein